MKAVPVEERFLNFVEKTNYCWNWIGAGIRYGQIRNRDKTIPAHRISWIIVNGPIPNGMCICHKCDNPRCVNPHHLFLGTHNDNVRDKMSKGRYRGGFGENHGFAKLTDKDIREIRNSYIPRIVSQRLLAKKFGVTQPTIQLILNRIWWKHVS